MDLNVLHKVMGASCRRCRRMPLNVRVFFFGSTFLEAKEPNFSFGSPFNVWQELLALANLRTATIDVAEPASHSCHIYNNLSAYDNVLYRSNFPQMNRIDFLVW